VAHASAEVSPAIATTHPNTRPTHNSIQHHTTQNTTTSPAHLRRPAAKTASRAPHLPHVPCSPPQVPGPDRPCHPISPYTIRGFHRLRLRGSAGTVSDLMGPTTVSYRPGFQIPSTALDALDALDDLSSIFILRRSNWFPPRLKRCSPWALQPEPAMVSYA
jgi:hypothetical protein